jgi:hypothetical protein
MTNDPSPSQKPPYVENAVAPKERRQRERAETKRRRIRDGQRGSLLDHCLIRLAGAVTLPDSILDLRHDAPLSFV